MLLCSYLGREAFAVLVFVLSLSLSLCYLQSVSQGIFVFVSPLACVFEDRNSYRDLGLREGEREAEL